MPSPTPPDFVSTWLESTRQARSEGTREAFAIVEDGAFLGWAGSPMIDRAGRTVELGYMVTPAARGRGVATEALRLLTVWAFDELDAVRAELKIGAPNEASKRVGVNCGYVHEATLRSTYRSNKPRWDLEIWSRLASDPYA
jgi:RimJ/RimL family protein N-acetyltransferase